MKLLRAAVPNPWAVVSEPWKMTEFSRCLSLSCDTLTLILNPQASKMSKKQTSLESFFVKGKRPMTTKKKKAAFDTQYQETYINCIATGDSQVYVRYLYQEDVHEDRLCALSLANKQNHSRRTIQVAGVIIYQENLNSLFVSAFAFAFSVWPSAILEKVNHYEKALNKELFLQSRPTSQSSVNLAAGSRICIICPFPFPESHLSHFGCIISGCHAVVVDYVIGFKPHWEHLVLLICQFSSNNRNWKRNRFQSFVWFTCIIYSW